MANKTSEEKIKEAIDLRINHRKTIQEISNIIGISRNTLKRYLKNYRLSRQEIDNNRISKQIGRKRRHKHNLINQKIGKLTVLYIIHEKAGDGIKWMCQCDCGNKKAIDQCCLIRKSTKSCGCLRFKQTVELVNFKKIFIYYKCGAKKRNLQFELSFLDCINLFKSNCCYCGIEPFNEYKKHSDIFNQRIEKCLYNGIDRQDNSKGYTKDNCVACCKFCNFAKGTHSLDEFLWWIKEIKKV